MTDTEASLASLLRHLDAREWRFLNRGRCSHGFTTAPTGGELAPCGVGPSRFRGWMGTGSQAEYERCAALPRCKTCVRMLAAEWGQRVWGAS